MSVLLAVGIRLLETIFVVGAVGSFVVLILSGIEDIETLLGVDEPGERGEQRQ